MTPTLYIPAILLMRKQEGRIAEHDFTVPGSTLVSKADVRRLRGHLLLPAGGLWLEGSAISTQWL
jgi:hypothetical protein